MKDNHEDNRDSVSVDDICAPELGDLHIDTLSGDMRDELVTVLKELQSPWSMLPEVEQHRIANRIEAVTTGVVRKAVRMLTDYEVPRLVVEVGDVKVPAKAKAELEAKITCPLVPENLTILTKLPRKQVVLCVVDSNQFIGEREPVKTDPDQPSLPVGKAEDEEDQKDDQDTRPEQDEPATPEEEGADGTDDSNQNDLKTLAVLAKLDPDQSASVADGPRQRLLEKGFIKQVGKKPKSGPAKFTITPAGRSALEG